MEYGGRYVVRRLYEVKGFEIGPNEEYIDIAVDLTSIWGDLHPGQGNKPEEKAEDFKKQAEEVALEYATEALKKSQQPQRVIVKANGTFDIEPLK